MRELEIKTAQITHTTLGLEDHDILQFMIHVKWDCGGVGIGGFALDGYDKATKIRPGWAEGFIMIRAILETLGVRSWEKLEGSYLRCKIGAWGDPVRIIGHIVEDKWIDLDNFRSKK